MQGRMRGWLQGSRGVAFLLGLGSLFAPMARATPPQAGQSGTSPPAAAVDATLRLDADDATLRLGGDDARLRLGGDDATLRLDGDRVFLAQRGGVFEPLALGDTPAARRLLDLLRRRGPHPIGLAPTVVADGAQGFSLDRSNPPPPAATRSETSRSDPGRPDAKKPAPTRRPAASS